MIEAEENNKYKEKVKQLSDTVKRLEDELETQRSEYSERQISSLRRAIQLLLYHLRKRKHRKRRQKRGYIPARWYQKLNFFEIVFGLSTVVLGIIGTNLIINQNKRLDQQTYLQEAERRSALVFLMGNIFDEMNQELKDTSNKEKYLSQPLIRQIISLSHGLRPYKFLVNDELTDKEYSPERGELLIVLANSGINVESLMEIYRYSDFSSSYLPKAQFRNGFLRGARLDYSNLSGSNLSKADLMETSLINADLFKVDLRKAWLKKSNVSGANFRQADLRGTKMLEITYSRGNNPTLLDSAKISSSTEIFYQSLIISGYEKQFVELDTATMDSLFRIIKK